ncbi:hypothetical protein CDL15_Pgr012722 [Punica granatum]|uniref:Uncharacterized protein n=1 Tax=Punica granatum TaxID=22663 RepID=A0A218XFI1_PUNGR|nr:hypothetical protein CDL15_Pgr012722 [Punica granatum]
MHIGDTRLHVLEEQGFDGKDAAFYVDKEYNERMEEFQRQLDVVQKMVKPGCSVEVLNVALASIASLVDVLDFFSSESNLRSSL